MQFTCKNGSRRDLNFLKNAQVLAQSPGRADEDMEEDTDDFSHDEAPTVGSWKVLVRVRTR